MLKNVLTSDIDEDIAVSRKPVSIRKVSESKKNVVVFYILIAVLLCTMILAYVWSFVKMVEIRVNLNKMTEEYKNIVKSRDDLLAEKAKLSATNRIEDIAKNRLKMVLPTRVEYVSLLSAYRRDSTDENILNKH